MSIVEKKVRDREAHKFHAVPEMWMVLDTDTARAVCVTEQAFLEGGDWKVDGWLVVGEGTEGILPTRAEALVEAHKAVKDPSYSLPTRWA